MHPWKHPTLSSASWLGVCLWKCSWNIILLPPLPLIMVYHLPSCPLLSLSLSLCLLNLWAWLSWPPILPWNGEKSAYFMMPWFEAGLTPKNLVLFLLVSNVGMGLHTHKVPIWDKYNIYQTLWLHFLEAQGQCYLEKRTVESWKKQKYSPFLGSSGSCLANIAICWAGTG